MNGRGNPGHREHEAPSEEFGVGGYAEGQLFGFFHGVMGLEDSTAGFFTGSHLHGPPTRIKPEKLDEHQDSAIARTGYAPAPAGGRIMNYEF